MEDDNSVFTSNIPCTCYDTTELYGLLLSNTVIPIIEEKLKPQIIVPAKTIIEKTYVSKKTSKRKVKTVAEIRKEYVQQMIADNLPSDLEKQHNYFTERIRRSSFRDEHVYDRAKTLLKSSSPILRSTWPLLTNINVEGLRYSRQYVIWNGKTVLLHGSRGGSTEYVHNFDISIKTASQAQTNAEESKYQIPTLCLDKVNNLSMQEMLDGFPKNSSNHLESEITLDNNCNVKEVNLGTLVCSNTQNEEDISDVLSGEWKNREYFKNQGNQNCKVKFDVNVETFLDDLSKNVESSVSGKDINNTKKCQTVQMLDTVTAQNNTFTAIKKWKSMDINIFNREKDLESSKLDSIKTCKFKSLSSIPNVNNNIQDCIKKCKNKFEDGLIDRKRIKASDSKCTLSSDMINENVNSSNEQRKCIKNLLIPLPRINCLNIEPLCMEHELYRCFCKGTFLKNLSSYNTCQETLDETVDNVPNSIYTKNSHSEGDENKYCDKIGTPKICATEKKDSVTNSSTVHNKNIKYKYMHTNLLNETERKIKTEIIEFEHENILTNPNEYEEKLMQRENLENYRNYCTNSHLNDTRDSTPTSDYHTTSQSTVPKDCSLEYKDITQSTAQKLNPDNVKAKNQFSLWIKQEYDHLKHLLDKGEDIILGKPHPNKIVLFPYTLLLSKYKLVKNYFLVNIKPPHRVYIVVNPMLENFKHCVNVKNMDIGKSLNEHCDFVKHLVLETPLTNHFTLLKGLDNAWEVLGLLSKRNDNNEETLSIPNAEYTNTFHPQNDNDTKEMLNVINHTCKWYYMKVENDFSELEFTKRNMYVKHETIISAIEMASSSDQTVYISFSKPETQKNEMKEKSEEFGIYIPPPKLVFNENCILIGPYKQEEDISMLLNRNYKYTGIWTREMTGIWITTEKSMTINEIIKSLPALPPKRQINVLRQERLKKKNKKVDIITQNVRKRIMTKPYHTNNPQNAHKMHGIKTLEATSENIPGKSVLHEFPVVGLKDNKPTWTYSAIPNHKSQLYHIPSFPIITTVGTLLEKSVPENCELPEHHSDNVDVETGIKKTEIIMLSKDVETPAKVRIAENNSITDTSLLTDEVGIIDENKITENNLKVSTLMKSGTSFKMDALISSEVDILNKCEIVQDPSIIKVEVPCHKEIKEDCLTMDVQTDKVKIVEENETLEDHSLMDAQVLAEDETLHENKMGEDNLIMNKEVPTEEEFLDENEIENDYLMIDNQDDEVKIFVVNETEKGNSIMNTKVLRDKVEMLEDNETGKYHSVMNTQVLTGEETSYENKMAEDNLVMNTQPTQVEFLDENIFENDYFMMDTQTDEAKILRTNETEKSNSIMNTEVLTDEVEMLEDNTGDNHSTMHSLKTFEEVKIVCVNVKSLGCIQGRRDSENKISFRYPCRPYSAFYSEDKAFATINLLFSKNMYIQKPFKLHWKVVPLDNLMENKTPWITKLILRYYFITSKGYLRLRSNFSRYWN